MNAPNVYRSRSFILEELLPKSIFESLAAQNRTRIGWLMLDDRILVAADALRARFGPLTCNNWHLGGNRNQSGLRVPGQTDYSPTSQHTFGRALDLISRNVAADEMRAEILANKTSFPGVHRVELSVDWLHIDCGNAEPITVFRP